jgi:hypothetical protein
MTDAASTKLVRVRFDDADCLCNIGGRGLTKTARRTDWDNIALNQRDMRLPT